ncbi:hypothetical protein P1X15_07560 [Runella sp. MFBS21]|uniref:hypothetical protein n=1 Tax=Runella sp. MFBS21 TaxID=3034018 RepID=UPI0023F9E8A7|nr:hypothetical protein [Runella sp. MFBS21]MDF7817445.1 hypothetical protein [Runella sp. MFBS21]
MKKLYSILLMGAVVLPSWAQLGYQTVWEKNYGSNVVGEFAFGQPYSLQTPNGSTLFAFPYKKVHYTILL